MDDIHKHYCVADFVVIAEEVLTCKDPMMIEFMEERRQGVALRMEVDHLLNFLLLLLLT